MNDKNGIGLILMQLGWTAIRMGDYPQAEMHLRDFLVLAQETENKTSLNYAYSGLGEVALRKGEVSRAKSLLENGLSLSWERGDRWAEATILGSLGWAALRSHNFDLTRNLLGRSLSIRMEIGDKGGMAWCLEKLAETTVLEGDYQKAVKIFGFAASLRNPIRAVIDPVDQPIYERLLSNLQSRLDTNIYLACWEEGQAMSLKDVISCALAEPALPITSRLLSDKEKYQGLSKRERETAVFIAQGKTNREISLLMTIGEKTVETYVTRILNKLGFNSRVQIATWAVEKGLTSFQKK